MNVRATWKLDDRVIRRRVCACGESERTVEMRPQTKDLEPLMNAVGIIQARMEVLNKLSKDSIKLPWRKGGVWKEKE